MKYKWLRSAMLTLVAGTALTACSTGETEKNSAEEDKSIDCYFILSNV